MNTPESEIKGLIDEWRSAICARDLDRLMALYSPGVVFFDVVPPHRHDGTKAYRQTWENCLRFIPKPFVSEIHNLHISVDGVLAFAHCLQRLVDTESKEPATCNWVRVTLCLRKSDGKWRVLHEHVSVPFDPQTSRAAFINMP
ncbi:MAG TPA: SgcJ/EcaC family oxidoreductase [Chthoniobacteraceae bacterium]|nr:SgcJ/EcaC family oxidoreductase [Chthoniobacteraceae bacterium]